MSKQISIGWIKITKQLSTGWSPMTSEHSTWFWTGWQTDRRKMAISARSVKKRLFHFPLFFSLLIFSLILVFGQCMTVHIKAITHPHIFKYDYLIQFTLYLIGIWNSFDWSNCICILIVLCACFVNMSSSFFREKRERNSMFIFLICLYKDELFVLYRSGAIS